MSEKIFNEKIGIFKDKKDRFDALLAIIVYDMPADELITKMKHRIELTKISRDNVKKHHIITKFNNIIAHIEQKMIAKKTLTFILIVDDSVNEINLEQSWLDNLINFKVSNYIFKYGETLDIKYLHDLLTDTSYYNVLCFNNTKLSHYYLSRTKKLLHNEIDKKNMDITEYINDAEIKDKILLHGVSGLLKNFKFKDHIVHTKLLQDDEILDIFETDENQKKCRDLDEILSNISNPKFSNKLLFGKDIQKKIVDKLVKTLYCSYEMSEKIKTIVPIDLCIFDVIVIKSYKPGDTGSILQKNYSGIIGLTFY
jgi:hypothetical protein